MGEYSIIRIATGPDYAVKSKERAKTFQPAVLELYEAPLEEKEWSGFRERIPDEENDKERNMK